MKHARAIRVVVWIAVLAIAATIVMRARFTADLSAFLPTRPTPEQALLIDQLRDGPASHLILIAIEGADPAALAKLSKATVAVLRSDTRFLSINNGETVTADRDRALMFERRYALSDRTVPERFTRDGLAAAMTDTLDLLASSAGLMLQSLVARDPTAEVVHLVEALTAGRSPPSVDGVWVVASDGRAPHALLVAETRAAGSDIDGQEAAIGALRRALDAARRSTGDSSARLVLTGPPVFAVEARNTIQREAELLAGIGLAAVALLLGFVYRSPIALVLGLLPMVTGAICGLAVVALGFGVVHGITLGFGVTLIGEAVDYAIYLFVQHRSDDDAKNRRFWSTIALGVATSAIGFAALTFSGFEGLAQIGVLSIVGLTVAAAVTRWLLPALMPAGFSVRPLPKVQTVLARAAAFAPRLRLPLVVAGIAACVVLAVHRDTLWSRDLASLSPVSAEDQATDGRLRAALGAPDVRDLVVVDAPDQETALRGSERVVAALTPLVAEGALAGIEAPSRFLPSTATQRARQAALPDDATLRRDFAAALDGLPFSKTGFDGFFADVARERQAAPVTSADLDGTSLAPAIRALLSQRSAADGRGRWTAVVALRSPPSGDAPRARIATTVAQLPADAGSVIRAIDIKNETQDLYAGYLSEAVRMAGAGAVAIVVLLAIALRDAKRLARVVGPLALAVVLVAAGHVVTGGMLTLFHLVGLLLIVAVGSNYALFFDRRAGDDGANDAIDGTVLTSLAVANLTAVIGFGVLGLSSLPVLHAIGSTVGPGALTALALAAVFAPQPA